MRTSGSPSFHAGPAMLRVSCWRRVCSPVVSKAPLSVWPYFGGRPAWSGPAVELSVKSSEYRSPEAGSSNRTGRASGSVGSGVSGTVPTSSGERSSVVAVAMACGATVTVKTEPRESRVPSVVASAVPTRSSRCAVAGSSVSAARDCQSVRWIGCDGRVRSVWRRRICALSESLTMTVEKSRESGLARVSHDTRGSAGRDAGPEGSFGGFPPS